MAQSLKWGVSAAQTEEVNARILSTDDAILQEVAWRGDAAVYELSQRFDAWSPPSR